MKHNPRICLSLPLVLCPPLGMDYTSGSGLAAYYSLSIKPMYGRDENERTSFPCQVLARSRIADYLDHQCLT